MNKCTLFVGAATMVIIGATVGPEMPAQTAVGLGLMWIGLATRN